MNIVIKPSDIKAEVYNEKGQRLYIKISIHSIGLFITGFTIEPSPKFPEKGLWVQTPAYFAFGKWRHHMEFASDSPLWLAIVDEVNRAAEHYRHEKLDATLPDDSDPLQVVKDIRPDAEALSSPKRP